jgi:hypothetical protein
VASAAGTNSALNVEALGPAGGSLASARTLPGSEASSLPPHAASTAAWLEAGWRGAAGDKHGVGAVNEGQLDAYLANQCFWRHEIPADARYFKHANRAYLDWAVGMGLIDKPDPIVLQLYSEVLQKFTRLGFVEDGPAGLAISTSLLSVVLHD